MLRQDMTKFVEGVPVDAPLNEANTQHVMSPGLMSGSIRFREFEVWPGDRLLLHRRKSVCIGSRAFDLLVVLLRSRGEIVSKEAIFEYVWPSTIVEESNLRFQVASLRKALGADRELIKSIPGRGYLFATDQDAEQDLDALAAPAAEDIPTGPFPRNVAMDCQPPPALRAPRFADPTGAIGDDALEMFFRSAGRLVAVYGSIDAVIGALVELRG